MSIIKDIQKLLSFNLTRTEMLVFNNKHLLAGIVGTWLVGMGRYWDDSKASLLQHLGVGSLIYIFVLAAFIWLILLPFKIDGWKYLTVLTFISLTSFPAIFYAIPVERFLSAEVANKMNVLFLAVVALWRLMLLHSFLKHLTPLPNASIITVTLLPICVIITSLTALNLHKVVFQIMGGMKETSAHDASYVVLMLLTGISAILTLPLLAFYLEAIQARRKVLKSLKQNNPVIKDQSKSVR